MKTLDYLIVGQGIAGSILDFTLRKNGFHGVVIDNGHKNSSSKVGAGLINPLTGRNFVKSWMFDEFEPRAKAMYQQLSALIGFELISPKNIIRILHELKDENEWEIRTTDDNAKRFRVEKPELQLYKEFIHEGESYGELTGAHQVHMPVLIKAYKQFLSKFKFLITQQFDYSKLECKENCFTYDGLKTEYVFFAEGSRGSENLFFPDLPFRPAKGEALIVKINDYSPTKILKQNVNLVPLGDGIFWVGSGFEKEFEDPNPSEKEKIRMTNILDDLLKIPYEIIDHIAAVRPFSRDRKPFIGQHMEHEKMFVFNGFGSKGASLVPYWSEQLVRHINFKEPLSSIVNPYRYKDKEN